MKRARVWGIPSPWDGVNEDEALRLRYRAWFRLYVANQRVRHLFGIHQRPTSYSIAPRCDWCGHRSLEQRTIAAANWDAMTAAPPAPPASGEPVRGGWGGEAQRGLRGAQGRSAGLGEGE